MSASVKSTALVHHMLVSNPRNNVLWMIIQIQLSYIMSVGWTERRVRRCAVSLLRLRCSLMHYRLVLVLERVWQATMACRWRVLLLFPLPLVDIRARFCYRVSRYTDTMVNVVSTARYRRRTDHTGDARRLTAQSRGLGVAVNSLWKRSTVSLIVIEAYTQSTILQFTLYTLNYIAEQSRITFVSQFRALQSKSIALYQSINQSINIRLIKNMA